MKHSLMQLPFFAIASVCLFVFGFSSLAFTQDNEEKLAVPENASVDELEKFIHEIQKYKPQSFESENQFLEFMARRDAAFNKAVDMVLASDNVSVEQKRRVLQTQIWVCLQGARDEVSTKKSLVTLQKIIDAVGDDRKMQSILFSAQKTCLEIRMNAFSMELSGNRDEFMQLDNDIYDFLRDKKHLFFPLAPNMLEIASSLYADESDLTQLQDKMVARYLPILPDSEAARLEGVLRRLRLPGNEMELKTATIDVKKLIADAGDEKDFDVMQWIGEQPANQLDIKSLEGKVVLVDCWATWCGPCLKEVPNMLEQYDKYHEKGFEIIGYSCDKNVSVLLDYARKENLPWIIGSTELSKKEGLKNYLGFYGISSIPAMILIGRDRRVISINARGETLNKLLEEQFAE